MFLLIAPGTEEVTKLKLSLENLQTRGNRHTIFHRQLHRAHNIGRDILTDVLHKPDEKNLASQVRDEKKNQTATDLVSSAEGNPL